MKHVTFKGKILIIGCGSVAQCAVPLVLELIDVPPSNVTIMDFVDNRERIQTALSKGVTYIMERITKDNYAVILKEYVGRGDIIIDLAWNIDCVDMLKWCRDNEVLYINTSVEDWDPYQDDERNDPTKYTLYTRHEAIKSMIKGWGDGNHATAIVDHGANPGLVSHFTKHALVDIAREILGKRPEDPRSKK